MPDTKCNVVMLNGSYATAINNNEVAVRSCRITKSGGWIQSASPPIKFSILMDAQILQYAKVSY